MAEQKVTLQPGESKVVSFEAIPREVKTYHISVDGLSGSFRAISPPWSITVAWTYTGEVGPGTDMTVLAYRVDLYPVEGKWKSISRDHPQASGSWLPYTITSFNISAGYFAGPGEYIVRVVPSIGWHHSCRFSIDKEGRPTVLEHIPATRDPRTIITALHA